jgi:GNAT superfamily N-acetyltransferase
MRDDVIVRPLTPSRWDDLVELFGDNGAWGGCWCMFFRVARKEFDAGTRNRGKENRAALKQLVERRSTPGLLAYIDGRPVGWCSVAPRSEFGRIERSPIVKPIDDEPSVWSIVCFYMHRGHRGEGVGTALLKAAVDHAARKGARIVEAYPVDPHGKLSNADAYHGLVWMFEKAGFTEVARRSDRRPIMRYVVAR